MWRLKLRISNDRQWRGTTITIRFGFGQGHNVLHFQEFNCREHVPHQSHCMAHENVNTFGVSTTATQFMIDNFQLYGNYYTFLFDSIEPFNRPYPYKFRDSLRLESIDYYFFVRINLFPFFNSICNVRLRYPIMDWFSVALHHFHCVIQIWCELI